MPVRSLDPSVLRLPDRDEVDRAVRRWATDVGARDERVQRVGYFGSYARGDWGGLPRTASREVVWVLER